MTLSDGAEYHTDDQVDVAHLIQGIYGFSEVLKFGTTLELFCVHITPHDDSPNAT